MITRRDWLLSALSSFVGMAVSGRSAVAAAFEKSSFEERIGKIEEASGGRLGVAILDTTTAVTVGHRSGERFPMCSTFKLLAVGAVLRRADQGREQLDRIVRVTQKDIVIYSPATEKRVDSGMSIEELCAAAITLSDNTAANLLLASIGGPPGVTAFARALGDDVTRLDRIEPKLNEALPHDPRDTSTPGKMLSDLRELVLGNALSCLPDHSLPIGWFTTRLETNVYGPVCLPDGKSAIKPVQEQEARQTIWPSSGRHNVVLSS